MISFREDDRDYGFDNIKVLLIFLVVLGHILEEISTEGNLGIIRACIYSFHMPAFIFISGYFTGNYRRSAVKSISHFLLPYIVFEILWMYVHDGIWPPDTMQLFSPEYIFWYLLCMVYWRLSAGLLSKIKGIFFISFAAAIAIGVYVPADRFLSVSRAVAFLPFFVLGLRCAEKRIRFIRRRPTVGGILGMVFCMLVTIYANVENLIPLKSYENIQAYVTGGMTNTDGAWIRIISYCIALLAIYSLINFMPKRKNVFTRFGERTESIYVLSGFLTFLLFYFVREYGFLEFLQGHDGYAVLFALAASAGIFWICGNRVVDTAFMSWIRGLDFLMLRERDPYERL